VAKTYEAIASQTLGSAASSVSFTSIPGTYTDLFFVAQISNAVAASAVAWMRFNGITSSIYSLTKLIGNGYSASSYRQSNTSIAYIVDAYRQNEITVFTANIMSYSNSAIYKTVLTTDANGAADANRGTMLARLTDAITSIVFVGGTNFAAGSTFSLYGIKAA